MPDATEKKPKRAKKVAETETAIIAYKGFDKNLQCRGYQYEVGKTYAHTGPVVQCVSGFHACQNPLDVLDYYDMVDGNRFAKVTLGGKIDRSDDKKWAAAELTVNVELQLSDLIRDAVRWVMGACKANKASNGTVTDGHSAKNASSGHYATNASSGHSAKNASSGHSAKNASSGHSATNASSGHYAKNASSGDYAKNASSGHYAKNASSGHYAKNASSGDYATNEALGEYSVIACAGRDSIAKGASGVWISLAEYKTIGGEWRCIGFASGQAGHDGVPADAWVKAAGGKLVAA